MIHTCIFLLVAINDTWHHSVLYTVANYSGMATRIQVFTELSVHVPMTDTCAEALTSSHMTFKRTLDFKLVTIVALKRLIKSRLKFKHYNVHVPLQRQ